MRYFLFSGIVHLALIVVGLFFLSDTLDFNKVGDPSVSFIVVGESIYASGSSNSPLNKPVIEEMQKKEAKQEKAVKKVEKTETLEEKIIEEKVEVPKLIEDSIVVEDAVEVPKEESIEEKEEVVKEAIEDVTQMIEESVKNIEPTENISTEENISKGMSRSSNTTDTSKSLGDGLVYLDDGSVAAKNQGVKGLEYGFLSQPEPTYPDIAKRVGVDEDIVIKVRFLIGYDGRVEDLKFYDDVTNFGFRSEVEKALSSWRATPITIDGKPVKLYFYKSFKFEKLLK